MSTSEQKLIRRVYMNIISEVQYVRTLHPFQISQKIQGDDTFLLNEALALGLGHA